MRGNLWRQSIAVLVALFILAPVALIVWQSFLSDAFFNPRARGTFEAYRFVLFDPGFWGALENTVLLSLSMIVIAVPLGSLLAFLVVRTDLPNKRVLEPLVFLPLFMSVWWKRISGAVP